MTLKKAAKVITYEIIFKRDKTSQGNWDNSFIVNF
jgi:hypothetical protein